MNRLFRILLGLLITLIPVGLAALYISMKPNWIDKEVFLVIDIGIGLFCVPLGFYLMGGRNG